MPGSTQEGGGSRSRMVEDPLTLVDVAPAADRGALIAARCADRCSELIDVVDAARRAMQTPAPAGLDRGCGLVWLFARRCREPPSHERPSIPRARLYPLPIPICALLRTCSRAALATPLFPRALSPEHIWNRLSTLSPFLPTSLSLLGAAVGVPP